MLLIGRSVENHLVLKNEKVSSKHCSIKKIDNNRFLVQDLGSSNGTFINGSRVLQSFIEKKDHLQLANFALDADRVISLLESGLPAKGTYYEDFLKQERVYDEFAKLKAVYDQYHHAKLKIMKSNNLKSTGIRAGLSVIPFVGSALGILTTGVTGNQQEEMLELEESFKKLYTCPGCFKFLGAEPFENMEKRGFCLVCKTKWKR